MEKYIDIPKIRIGLCGSGGTGKTTLANAFAEKTGYPIISEGVRSYLKSKGITHLRELGSEGTKLLQKEVLERKIKLETEHSHFISDRTTLDNAAYCLRWLAREEGIDSWMEDYIKKCFDHAKEAYDVIVICPWGAIPLEDDGIRSGKRWYQYEIQKLIEGLALDDIDTFGKVHFLKSESVKDRVEELIDLVYLSAFARNVNLPDSRQWYNKEAL